MKYAYHKVLSLFSATLILAMTTQLPVAFAQNLPPMQDPGSGFQTYSQPTPNYTQNTYQQPSYGQQQPSYAQPSYGQQPSYGGGYTAPQALQGYVASAPAGTFMSASITTPISSEFARVGDRFNASLGSPITGSDGSILLPSGSQMEGQVVMVRPAGRTGRNGEIEVRFTGATLPNGQRVALSARVQTEDGTGLIKGGSTKGRIGRAALNTAVGAGLGAALGTAMGPLSGGEVGRGAIYGTAVGGGLGAAKALWNKGEEALLQAGQPVNIVLDAPLTVSPQASAPAYSQQPSYGGYNQQPSYSQPSYGGGYNNQQPNYGY